MLKFEKALFTFKFKTNSLPAQFANYQKEIIQAY